MYYLNRRIRHFTKSNIISDKNIKKTTIRRELIQPDKGICENSATNIMLNGVNPSYPKPKSRINIVLEFQASVIKQKKKIHEWHPV